jgi:hypothetical protein
MIDFTVEAHTLCFALFSGQQIISFSDAARFLIDELHYPEDRALQFVRRFDRNNDGYLSVPEFNNFKKIIDDT